MKQELSTLLSFDLLAYKSVYCLKSLLVRHTLSITNIPSLQGAFEQISYPQSCVGDVKFHEYGVENLKIWKNTTFNLNV